MTVVVIGIVMVGAADLFKESRESGMPNAIVGDIIIVSATVCSQHHNNLKQVHDA